MASGKMEWKSIEVMHLGRKHTITEEMRDNLSFRMKQKGLDVVVDTATDIPPWPEVVEIFLDHKQLGCQTWGPLEITERDENGILMAVHD